MLGQNIIGWIDRRCRQSTCHTDEVFGGKSIILIDDPSQLPPAADKPLYHAKPSSSMQEQGYFAYFLFNCVVKLTVNQRVRGLSTEQAQFRDLLMHLRTGDSDESDCNLLLSRQPLKIALKMLQGSIIAMMKLQITTLKNYHNSTH